MKNLLNLYLYKQQQFTLLFIYIQLLSKYVNAQMREFNG